MRDRVNACAGGRAEWLRAAGLALCAAWLPGAACASTQRIDDGGSRVEIIYLKRGTHPSGKPPAVALGGVAERADELGDGSVASELLAGARRLVDLQLPGGSERFEAHLRVVALWDGRRARAASAKAGDVVELDGRVAVCERVAADGARTFIGPDEDDVVRRFVLSAADVD